MRATASIRLVQITDTHLFGDRAATLRGVQPFATLQAVRTHAAQHFANADGVLLTGDLVHDDATGYSLIREAFGNSSVPVYCVPGNHDVPDAMYRELTAAPFRIGQVAVADPWIIVLMNSWVQNSAGGELGQEQLDQVSETLTAHPNHFALICLHHHPIAMGSQWLDRVGLKDATALQDCLAPHTNVRGVLWGHVHQALDRDINGVHYMATPATCAQFLAGSDQFAVDNKPPGYRTLELMPDGSIVTQVVWLD